MLALFPLSALFFPALLASARHPALAQALIVLAFSPAALSFLATASRDGHEGDLVCALLGVSVGPVAHRRRRAAGGAAQPTRTDQASEQDLLNLLRSGIAAKRFARAGGHRTVVRTACESAQRVVVTTQDNGPGLSSGDQKRTFLPFYTTTSDGLEMGVAISGSIEEEHAGRV